MKASRPTSGTVTTRSWGRDPSARPPPSSPSSSSAARSAALRCCGRSARARGRVRWPRPRRTRRAPLDACAPSGGGGPCYAPSDCVVQKCDLSTDTCPLGEGGDPCPAGADCKSGTCDPENDTCTASPASLPPNASCQATSALSRGRLSTPGSSGVPSWGSGSTADHGSVRESCRPGSPAGAAGVSPGACVSWRASWPRDSSWARWRWAGVGSRPMPPFALRPPRSGRVVRALDGVPWPSATRPETACRLVTVASGASTRSSRAAPSLRSLGGAGRNGGVRPCGCSRGYARGGSRADRAGQRARDGRGGDETDLRALLHHPGGGTARGLATVDGRRAPGPPVCGSQPCPPADGLGGTINRHAGSGARATPPAAVRPPSARRRFIRVRRPCRA